MSKLSQKSINDILTWQRIWGDNSKLTDNERGIISFSRMVFPDHIEKEYGIPDIHRHVYEDLLSLYSSKLRFLTERQRQLIIFRGASKSTIALGVFLTYIICFNGLKIT